MAARAEDGGTLRGPWSAAREAPAPSTLATEFAGGRRAILRLAFGTALLTLLTLGAYRFWARTRLRRWYWSAIRPGGHPLEYTGDPWEKLLGFLLAVVVLAFYLGIVNLGLMFASLAILEDYVLPTIVTSLGLVPMIFYARYRARRYLLARTRWRGVRFGMEPGALGYAGRALMHWAITILTLGVLWPRMTFWLEKYRTDRTTFGDVRLEQGGRWRMLIPGAFPVWIGVILAGLGTLAAVASETGEPVRLPDALASEAWIAAWIALVPLGLLVAGVGAVHYSVRSFRLLAGAKRARVGGERLGLRAAPRTGRVLGIVVLGNLLSLLAVLAALALLGGAVAALAMAAGGGEIAEEPFAAVLASPAVALVPLAFYVLAFLLWGALRHALVTMPLLRHYAVTLAVTGAEALPKVRQSERDEAREAGGLAEALDVGGAI